MKIEGRSGHAAKSSQDFLIVDTVNGGSLTKPISMDVNNARMPDGVRRTLKGYQLREMNGRPSRRR